jgi:hypothetical protein
MTQGISKHAILRMRQRGISASFLTRIFDNADVERPANDNCRLYRVTKDLARALGDDRLARFAVIWSDNCGQIVTVVCISRGRTGARYRKRH